MVIRAGPQVVVNPFVWDTYLAQPTSSDLTSLADFSNTAALNQRVMPPASLSTAGPDREETLRLVLEVAASITGAWLWLYLPTRHRRAAHLPLLRPPGIV